MPTSSRLIHNLLLSNWIVFNCYLIYTFAISIGRRGLNIDANRTDKSLCLLVNGGLYQFVTITFSTLSLMLLIVYSAWWFLLMTYPLYWLLSILLGCWYLLDLIKRTFLNFETIFCRRIFSVEIGKSTTREWQGYRSGLWSGSSYTSKGGWVSRSWATMDAWERALSSKMVCL